MKTKFITINTSALVEILPILKKPKNDYLKDLHKYQDEIWDSIFNLQKIRKQKLKNYSFNYQIQTDGFAVSINYINNDEIENKLKMCNLRAIASKRKIIENKTKTPEEILEAKSKTENDKKEAKLKKNIANKELIKKRKEEFKKLSKSERDEIILQKRLAKNEFNYISDLINISDYLKLLNKAKTDKKLVYGDPGKRSPLMLMGENGLYYNYTTKTRIKETKRMKYNTLIQNKRNKTKIEIDGKRYSISEVETKLCEFSNKTIEITKFTNYLKLKLKLRNKIHEEQHYNNYLMKLNWFSYINKKRHEDKLLNKLSSTYGEDAIFVIGDWSNKGRLKFISTPNVGLQRKIATRFKVFHIDEYKTSKICYKTEEECSNLVLPVLNKTKQTWKLRKLHPAIISSNARYN